MCCNGRELVRMEVEAAEDLKATSDAVPLTTLAPQRSGPPENDSEFQIAAGAALRSMYPLDTPEQGRRRLMGVTSRAVRGSENAITEAWAIRRLESRFHGAAELKPSTQSRHLLETMATEHLLALRSHIAELDELLAPILSRMATEEPLTTPPPGLFAAVERLRLLVQGAFVGHSAPPGSPAEVSGRSRL